MVLKKLVDHRKLQAEVNRNGQLQSIRLDEKRIMMKLVQPLRACCAVDHHVRHAELFDAGELIGGAFGIMQGDNPNALEPIGRLRTSRRQPRVIGSANSHGQNTIRPRVDVQKEARVEKLYVNGLSVEGVQPLFQVGQGLTAHGRAALPLYCLPRRRGRPGSARSSYGWSPVGSLTVNHPEIISLVIAEQSRAVISEWRFHVLLKHFFRLKIGRASCRDKVL